MTAVTLEISPVREPMQPRILIADDQQDVLDALRLLLKGHGYSIVTVNSPVDLHSPHRPELRARHDFRP